jgi:hypothetical protein
MTSLNASGGANELLNSLPAHMRKEATNDDVPGNGDARTEELTVTDEIGMKITDVGVEAVRVAYIIKKDLPSHVLRSAVEVSGVTFAALKAFRHPTHPDRYETSVLKPRIVKGSQRPTGAVAISLPARSHAR